MIFVECREDRIVLHRTGPAAARAAILRLAATGAVRHEAFPDRLSIELAERDHRRLLSAGGADHFLAVNEGRLSKIPHRASSAEVRHQVALPNNLPVGRLEARHITRQPHDIKAVPIHCRSGARTFFRLRPTRCESRRDSYRPHFLAVLVRKSPDHLVTTAMAHSIDSPGGNRRGAIAAAKTFDLPGERRAILRPFLEQAGLFGMGRSVRSLPLRPIKLSA